MDNYKSKSKESICKKQNCKRLFVCMITLLFLILLKEATSTNQTFFLQLWLHSFRFSRQEGPKYCGTFTRTISGRIGGCLFGRYTTFTIWPIMSDFWANVHTFVALQNIFECNYVWLKICIVSIGELQLHN